MSIMSHQNHDIVAGQRQVINISLIFRLFRRHFASENAAFGLHCDMGTSRLHGCPAQDAERGPNAPRII
jgi:hypothetical protein